MAKLWKHLGFGQKRPQAPFRPYRYGYGIGRGQPSDEGDEEEAVGHTPIQLKSVHFKDEDGEDDSCPPVLVQEYSDPLDCRSDLSATVEEDDDGMYVVPVEDHFYTEPSEPQKEVRGQPSHVSFASEVQEDAYEDVCISESSTNIPEDDTRPTAEYDDPWELRLGMRLASSLEVSPSLGTGRSEQFTTLSYPSTSGDADFGPESSSLFSSETFDSVDSDEMARQMYESAFDCRIRQEVEDIGRLANSSMLQAEFMFLKREFYPEIASSASSSSGSSSTTPTRQPRPLPRKPVCREQKKSLPEITQVEKGKASHVQDKSSPVPSCVQARQRSPTNGHPAHQEDKENYSGCDSPVIRKKIIRGHQGVKVLPTDVIKQLSKPQIIHPFFSESADKDYSGNDIEYTVNCKVVKSKNKDDQCNSVLPANGAIPKSESSGSKGMVLTVVKAQSEENDSRPQGEYDPPWDVPSPCSSLDEFVSAQSLSSSSDVPSIQSSHSFLIGGRRDPSTDCRCPGDYDPPWDLSKPIHDAILSDSSHNPLPSSSDDPPSSKSTAAINQYSGTKDTRPPGDYDPPWDIPKHGKPPQQVACSSHSDGTEGQTISKDPRVPTDYDPPWDLRKPCLQDLRKPPHHKGPQTPSDEVDSMNVKEVGIQKPSQVVKKPKNLPSTPSEAHQECDQTPSRNRDIDKIIGAPKRPGSLPLQNAAASPPVTPTTRGQNILPGSGSSSHTPVRGPDSAKPSSSKGQGPSSRSNLNLNLNAANVPKRARKQVAAVGETADSVAPLEKQGWYHGCISRLEAEKVLKVLKEGSYLVRKSESSKQGFSLSLRSARGFMHMKIVYNDGKFILGQFSKPFDTIPEMIRHYSVNKLPIKGAEHMSLLHPVMYQSQ